MNGMASIARATARAPRLRALAILGATIALLTGCARGGGEGAAKPVALGALRVAVANLPRAPRIGENTLVVRVTDAAGRPVDAEVAVTAGMPAMGAMPAMESRGRVARQGAGEVRARYGLAMAGDWELRVRVTAPGQAPVEGTWRLSTTRGALDYAGADEAAGGGAPDTTADPGALVLDAARQQAIGLTTGLAEERTFDLRIVARGTVAYDETGRAIVSPRYAGWVRRLAADFVGKPVRKGDLLCTVDSPELNAAQEEYLSALRFAGADSTAHAMAFGSTGAGDAAGGAAGGRELSLGEAARLRLLAWDIPPDVVKDIARRGAPLAELPLRAPASGVIVEKNVAQGSPIAPGQVLFAIARVDPAWIEARVAETDLAHLKVGAAATVRAPGDADDRHGRVTFIAPALDPDSRTAVARISLANRDGALKPGMFVDAAIAVPLGRRLAVPEGAVVPTGARSLVFIDKGGGKLVAREVETGAHSDGWIEITRGVAAGDRVVTSGNFLVAADARLAAAIRNW
jgi:Cu(I)/Ag(I) efflux system membrane fusion protein